MGGALCCIAGRKASVKGGKDLITITVSSMEISL